MAPRFLVRLERLLRRLDPHLRATEELSDLDAFELELLDRALREGTSVLEQREVLGFRAPAHPFSPRSDLRCSVCLRPYEDHDE